MSTASTLRTGGFLTESSRWSWLRRCAALLSETVHQLVKDSGGNGSFGVKRVMIDCSLMCA
jgi:hypothetical protein